MVLDTAELNKLKDRVCAEIDTLREEAEFIATDMHQHPEVGWDTPRSAGLLTDYMERHGMKVEKGLAGLACSFRGSIRGREDQRPGISLLAEYDALPGLGHACSHNLIGTAAATAGIALTAFSPNIRPCRATCTSWAHRLKKAAAAKSSCWSTASLTWPTRPSCFTAATASR